MRAELSKKDSVIASIEDQVAAVSAAFEVRIKKSEERASQLNAELAQLRSTREEERSDALSKVQGVRTELDEIRDRHQAASALVRSLKAEQIRLERAAKDAELRANESDARFRKATARVGVLEDELAWHSQEKARIATQAQKMSRLFSEMANGGARGGGSAGGESVAKGRSP